MHKPIKRKIALGVIVIALLATAVLGLPIASDLWRISKVRDQYRVDDIVHNEIISDAVHKPTAEYVLDPPFMGKYGLSSKDYLDADGYFSPNGTHWAKWNLETKTAAVLMWRERTDLSAWDIRQTIRLVNDYYQRNDKTVPVVKVLMATTKL